MQLKNSDAVIKGSQNISEEIEKHIVEKQIAILDFQSPEDYGEAYSKFYLTEVL